MLKEKNISMSMSIRLRQIPFSLGKKVKTILKYWESMNKLNIVNFLHFLIPWSQ